jgi:hypothetical protein
MNFEIQTKGRKVLVRPLSLPNYVLPVSADPYALGIHVSQLTRVALEAMIEQYRIELLRKAGYT